MIRHDKASSPMSFPTLHCIRRLRLVAMVCLLSGCWQEIEYREDEPVAQAAADDAAQAEATPPPNQTANEALAGEPPPVDAQADAPAPANDSASAGLGDRYSTEAPTASLPPGESPSEPTTLPTPEARTVSATVESTAPTETVTTRRAAWLLGSRLGLAALAHDRDVAPEETVVWFDEARAMAGRLNTTVNDLPDRPSTAGSEPASREVLSYLLGEGKRIGGELGANYGPDHAAIFETALKSNLLLVLNKPGSTAVGHIAAALERAAPQAKLPEELWRPLLDTLENQSPPVAVRAAVREMHANVARHLAAEAGQ
jgi:hypothetical protein